MVPVYKVREKRCPKCCGSMSAHSVDEYCLLCETAIEERKNQMATNWLAFFIMAGCLLWGLS